jgi:hypothetical protein
MAKSRSGLEIRADEAKTLSSRRGRDAGPDVTTSVPKPMLYMVIERFKNGDAGPVYRRFAEQGRLAPEGLHYVASWVRQDLQVCYQVMESEHPALLQEWIGRWDDLVDFEVIPVLNSEDAARAVAIRE